MISYQKTFDLLKKRQISTYQIRKEKILGENTLTAMRHNENINTKNIDKLCKLLNCQPGDLMEYIPDDSEESKKE